MSALTTQPSEALSDGEMAEVDATDEKWMHEPMLLPKRPTLDELTFADGIDDHVSPEDVHPTIDAAKELIGTKFNTAARLIHTNREIKRLIRAKLVFDKAKHEMVPVAWKLDTQQRAAAIAHFLFTDSVDTAACKQCEHSRSLGPMEQCVAGGRDVVGGACFNCYYSGSGGRCSIRTDREAKEQKERENDEIVDRFPGFDRELLNKATIEDINNWMGLVDTEIRRRSRFTPGAPKRKRKRVVDDDDIDERSTRTTLTD